MPRYYALRFSPTPIFDTLIFSPLPSLVSLLLSLICHADAYA